MIVKGQVQSVAIITIWLMGDNFLRISQLRLIVCPLNTGSYGWKNEVELMILEHK